MAKGNNYDLIVIGGGFFGCALSLHFRKYFKRIAVVERESDLIKKASYNNQARVHNGYHYPRSFLTAVRSHKNYQKFIKDYKFAVYDKFDQYYAIASNLSKTTSYQFFKFCKQLGSPIEPAEENIKNIFRYGLVDDVFKVKEIVFDADKLKEGLKKEMEKRNIKIYLNTNVIKIERNNDINHVILKKGNTLRANVVVNCTYSSVNEINSKSNFPLLPIKHEFIEMPLVSVPEKLKNIAITILDGPFFGFLPFPDENCHSFWHVRYSIHASWSDPGEYKDKLLKLKKKSNWNFMKKDAQRFIPALDKMGYIRSIYETKTVLLEKEENDARPILFKRDWGIKNYFIVLGGKIDNIYDIISSFEGLKRSDFV